MKYRLGAFLIYWSLKMLLATCKVRVHNLDHWTKTAAKGSYVLAFWHNQIGMAPFLLNPHKKVSDLFVSVISNSKDARWLEAVMRKFTPTDVLKVPHNKRPQALKAMIQVLKQPKTALIITPDGPRGPRYHVKPGAVAAAANAHVPIVPIKFSPQHFWELSTWDRFKIPKPFTTIDCYFLTPIATENLDKSTLKKSLEHLLNK